MAGLISKEYLEFFTEFVNDLNVHDQLPVPVSAYNVDDEELVGDFVNWLLQYLNQKHCPLALQAPLVRSVVDEMLHFCKKDPEAHSLRDDSGQFSQLRLMQACMARVNALCVRLHQAPELFVPPPAPKFTPVAAHAVRSSQRRGMEDRHVVVNDFNGIFNVQDDTTASYYAVFDGHAGADAAVFSASHVHQFLAESQFYPSNPVQALKEAILRTDNLYLKKVAAEPRYQSGTTALCTLLRGKMMHVAWVGDSQAVLVRNGKAESVVDPHKPKRPDEEARINAQGGVVLFHGMWRVNGQLAVSRAIGDANFKPYVCAEAEVRSIPLRVEDEFLIMASDGLLDFVTPQEAAYAVFQQLRDNHENLNAVCSRLINLAKQNGSTDDISVIVIFLGDPQELAKKPAGYGMDSQDLIDAAPASPPHVNGNNQWRNPYSFEQTGQKQPLALHTFGRNDLDLGPETNIDNIGDSDDEDEELKIIQQQSSRYDGARDPQEDTPTPPADQAGSADAACGLDPDADNESDSDGDEDWQYIKVEPSKEEPCEQLLPQHQAEQLPLPVDPEEEKKDEPKPVLEDELLAGLVQSQDNLQLEQLKDNFEFSLEVENKQSSELPAEELQFEQEEKQLAEEAFTTEVKLTIGDLAQETSEFEEQPPQKQPEEPVQQFEEELNKLQIEEPQTFSDDPLQVKEQPEGYKQVPSNLDLQLFDPDMDYKLNPDAKEFVPVHSPTRETFPTSTTPLSPDAPNFEPLVEHNPIDLVTTSAVANDLFGLNGFEADRPNFQEDLNPFTMDNSPFQVENSVQMASPSYGVVEAPSFAVLETVGTPDAPVIAPIPEAVAWPSEAEMEAEGPQTMVDELLLEAAPLSPVKDDFGPPAGLAEVPQSPVKEEEVQPLTLDFALDQPPTLAETPISPAKDDFLVSPVQEDLPALPVQVESPYQEEKIVICPVWPKSPDTEPVSLLMEEQPKDETLQPDLLEIVSQKIAAVPEPEPVKEEILIPEEVKTVEEEKPVIEEEIVEVAPSAPVQSELELKIQEDEPKVNDSLTEATANLKIDTPEENKVLEAAVVAGAATAVAAAAATVAATSPKKTTDSKAPPTKRASPTKPASPTKSASPTKPASPLKAASPTKPAPSAAKPAAKTTTSKPATTAAASTTPRKPSVTAKTPPSKPATPRPAPVAAAKPTTTTAAAVRKTSASTTATARPKPTSTTVTSTVKVTLTANKPAAAKPASTLAAKPRPASATGTAKAATNGDVPKTTAAKPAATKPAAAKPAATRTTTASPKPAAPTARPSSRTTPTVLNGVAAKMTNRPASATSNSVAAARKTSSTTDAAARKTSGTDAAARKTSAGTRPGSRNTGTARPAAATKTAPAAKTYSTAPKPVTKTGANKPAAKTEVKPEEQPAEVVVAKEEAAAAVVEEPKVNGNHVEVAELI
ncbi:proteoglycan 4-like [Neocloeon triangulifer]|uniref:proteoglycan 4-like n=1 Tax=Neocloeon triangulifer TaxID=2078957 RepID=UPI00286F54A1|nr:proteoglycan 4-like [Neocloeon triangulifer]